MRKARFWLVVLALLAPVSLTAGPRVDFSGEWCARCCGTWCPFDGVGFYEGCLPDLDGSTCVFNDRHYFWVGGCR